MRARPKQDATVSVRITRDEERVVRQLAKRQRSTVSHVIRSAVSDLVRREERKPLRPYDQIADVIGSVAGLSPDLAGTTGEQLAEMMREKAGKRK
jgi:VIT1/CCC1 family predicted Fe2+/Mn2+ transporter